MIFNKSKYLIAPVMLSSICNIKKRYHKKQTFNKKFYLKLK
jgi:hypothetical protein